MHDNGQWCPTVAYAPSPEYISDAWEQYRKGQLPDAPPTYLYIPSMVDSSLAPEGKHSATIFTPYFPTGLDADENRSWKEQYADTCVRIFDKFAPGFADSVTNRVVFSNRYFGSTFSAHAGDYSHGLLQPNQLWTGRVVEGERQVRHAGRRALPVRPMHPPWSGGDRHSRLERRRSGPQAPQRAGVIDSLVQNPDSFMYHLVHD